MNVPFFDIKRQYAALKTELEAQVLECMQSCSYIGGSYVSNFERNMARFLGVGHAMGCASGTSALVLALRACGIQDGDEVITTPFSFFATAEAIATLGATPVFVDICPNDYNLDPKKIEAAITNRTKAILPVHIFGTPCAMPEIMDIARKYGLKVIEDCAQAIGAEFCGRKMGTWGDIGCFSFYPTKNLGGCGDGGMVVTNDDDLYTILLALHEHGAGQNGVRAYSLLSGVQQELSSAEQVTDLYNPYKYYNYLIGYNDRLDALQACVLDVKRKHLEEFNQRRAKIADMYRSGLTSKLGIPSIAPNSKPCWHQFVVRSRHKQELCDYLHSNGVGCGTFYPVPLHRQEAFNHGRYACGLQSLPVAEQVASETVCLPVFPELTDAEIHYVISTVNRFYESRD